MTLIWNLAAWVIYSATSFCLLFPFFGTTYERISAALLVGFLFGLLNRIAQGLDEIVDTMKKDKELVDTMKKDKEPNGRKVLL